MFTVLDLADRQQRHGELTAWLERSTAATLRQIPLALGKVATVLDRSYSSSGSREKRRRPLGAELGYIINNQVREQARKDRK